MDTASPASTGETYYFDAANGVVKASKTGIQGYGKGTTVVGNDKNTQDGYTPSTSVVDKVVEVEVVPGASGVEPTITISWVEAA